MSQNIESSLRKNLKDVAGSTIYGRGMGYYRSGYIQSLKVFLATSSKNKIEIRGGVEGTRDYMASLTFDFKKMMFNSLRCSCPYGSDCKHSVTLGLKFIELFQELYDLFSRSSQYSNNLGNQLVEYINSQDLAKAYVFNDDEDYNNDYDYDYDYDYDNEEEYDDEVINGEFEDVEENYENRTKEELMEELKMALSIGDAPQDVVNRLIREIANRGADGESQRNLNSGVALSDKNKNLLIPESAFEKKKFNLNDFCIVIESDYYDENNIEEIIIAKNNFSAVRPDMLLQEYENFTEAQKYFLQLLSPGSNPPAGYGDLFRLLRDTGMRIFWEKGDTRKQIVFENEDESQKIKAELYLENIEDSFSRKQKSKFVFRLSSDYKKNNSFHLFFDQDLVVKREGENVSFHQLSKILVNLISRIRLDGFGGNKNIEVDLENEEMIKLNRILKDAQQYLDLKTNLSPDFQITKHSSSEPCMVVDYNHKNDSLEVQATIDYGLKKVDVKKSIYRYRSRGEDVFERRSYDKYIIELSKKKIEYALVKNKKEKDLYKQFRNFGKECGFNGNLECKMEGEKAVFKYFSKHWDNVKNLGYKIEFIQDEFQFISDDFEAGFNVDLDAENDWLGFDVNCYCGESQIGLDDLRKYINDKKEFIKLDGGRILKVTNREELERFVFMLESFHAKEGNKFEGKLYHATELEDIFTSSKHYNTKIEKSFEKFMAEVKSGKPIRKVKIPERFDKVLRDYQKDGINWFYFLRKYRFAGILADDMGLGKTLQTLVLLEKEKVKSKPSVVICPKTLLYNWQNEVEKFTPKLKAIVIDGSPEERKKLIKKAKNFDLVITGYATMQRDSEAYDKQKVKFNYCVLDEAQFIKNHSTKNAQIVKKIDADYRLALTGTPLENSVSEIWSIFDFLMPGFLGSYNSFVKKFQNPIMKQNDILALKNLRKKTECFMLRRVKSEVLKELPPKVEQVGHCHLEKAQNILYQEILANVKSEIFKTVENKGFNKSRIHILAGLTKLRQVCNHPVLLLKDKDYTKYESAKLNMFLELIDEMVGNKSKVLVFSQFTKMLDILAEELDKKNISYSYLSGKTKKRQELVDDFNENDEKQVFLISLKAGGTGLNLTSASDVIIFDPWWNPSVENQAVDRAHRIGQKKSVNVYRLITKGTIEERIVKLQEKKKFLFDNLVGESKDLFTKLTWNDIKELFR